MKVTLQVNGQEMSFSEQELIAIVEEHFSTKTTKKAIEVVETPAVGKWFEVNPLAINQQLFEKKREDLQQETTRKLILEAFTEVKKDPEKYAPFQTMMPEKTWSSRTVTELKELAGSLGDCIADWVHQSLEWAQRITNGETWEAICNEADTANWFRLILWKDGYTRQVGGSRNHHCDVPASYVHDAYTSDNSLSVAVPLVVKYK